MMTDPQRSSSRCHGQSAHQRQSRLRVRPPPHRSARPAPSVPALFGVQPQGPDFEGSLAAADRKRTPEQGRRGAGAGFRRRLACLPAEPPTHAAPAPGWGEQSRTRARPCLTGCLAARNRCVGPCASPAQESAAARSASVVVGMLRVVIQRWQLMSAISIMRAPCGASCKPPGHASGPSLDCLQQTPGLVCLQMIRTPDCAHGYTDERWQALSR